MTSRTLDGGSSARPAPDPGPVAVPAWPQRMDNPVRRYDWGSRHVLATLQGRPAPGHPEAELWMGAHPGAPSALPDASGAPALDALVDAAPAAVLGRDVHRRFGPRLPFLLKVLAVDRALSVQVHPDPEQAARGHAREEAAGVPIADPARVYQDPHAKPEMLYALTAFEALAGLRPVVEASALVASLAAGPSHHRTASVAALLDGAPDVTAALTGLVRWPTDDRRALVEEVAGLAAGVLSDGGLPDGDRRAALGWVTELAVQHPADPLVLGPLLMRLHRMAPGGTLYLPAGVPHAYLTGVGVEVLAASDNVVRAGLTSKHVDASALLDLLDPAAHPLTEVPTVALGPGETAFRPPVAEFQLCRVEVRGSVRPAELAGPQVLLCLSGAVAVAVGAATGSVQIAAGGSAFVGAGAGPLLLTGDGLVFRAAVGRP